MAAGPLNVVASDANGGSFFFFYLAWKDLEFQMGIIGPAMERGKASIRL